MLWSCVQAEIYFFLPGCYAEVFVKLEKGNQMGFLGCYVDEMGLFGDGSLIDFLSTKIGERFEETDFAKLSLFLGLKFEHQYSFMSFL